MCNRTPSYVVAGLVLVIILLGFFYTSCSSTSIELRRALSRFEKRVQTVSSRVRDERIEPNLVRLVNSASAGE